jgi:hypothetical protein
MTQEGGAAATPNTRRQMDTNWEPLVLSSFEIEAVVRRDTGYYEARGVWHVDCN